MITRRTALGAGLAFASVACSASFKAYAQIAGRHPDALLVDGTIELPRQMTAFIEASRPMLPVVSTQLDAISHGSLMNVLARSNTVIGISSGATLFCLERMGWDHGFRLTGRSQRSVHDFGNDRTRHAIGAFLNDGHLPAQGSSSAIRSYQASRGDGMLHAWLMQKYDGTRLRTSRQEA